MEPFGKGGAGVPKKQDQNMQELLNLLGPTSNNAPPPQQQVVQPQPPQAAAHLQSAAAAQPKQQQPSAAAIARAQMLRQHQMQQAQQAQLQQRQALQQKQQQQQRAAAAASAAPPTGSQGVVNELEEILRANHTAPQAPAQAQPQQVAQAQQQRRPVSAPSNNRSTASVVSGQSSRQQQQAPQPNARRMTVPNQPAPPGSGRSSVTQEQVIVGHFCRHALACLTRLTANLDNSAELQTNLKSAIKRLWAEWVANRISKTALLETVARIVRSSCPGAANINVISEFRAWYHAQLNAQRTNRAGRGNPAAPAEGANRQPGAPQAAPTAQQIQFARNAAGVPQTQQQIMLQQQAAQRAAIAAAAGINNIGAATAKASGLRNNRGIAAKQEKTAYASKSLPAKTVAAKTVPRNVNMNRVPPQAHAAAALAQQRAAAIQAHQMKYGTVPGPNGALRQARPGVVRKVGGPNIKNEQILQGMVPGGANVNMAGKRLADPAELSMAQKKARAGGKFPKSPSKVRKAVPGVMGVPAVAMMPGMGRGMAMAGRLNPTAIPNVARFGPGALPQQVRPGVIQPVAASVDPKKPSKKTIDNDLNVVDSIVDIDNEQNALVGGSQIVHELSMHENGEDFSKNLLLDGRVVRAKVERAMAKHGLTGPISKEIIELISHSCQERLSYVFENVAEHANARVEPIDKNGGTFVSRDAHKDVRAMLDKMRDDEEKALAAAAMKRTSKWRKEEEERSAREAAENSKNNTDGNKSDKAAQAEADKKKKAKAAVEKKKAADSLQRSALSGAMSSITKKRKKKANLAPLMLGAGGSMKSVSGKTTSQAASKSNALNMNINSATIAAATSNPAAAQALSAANGNTTSGKKNTMPVRTAIKLEDCLAFFGNENNMRQSALVYKWYTRLHAPPPPQPKMRTGHPHIIRKQ